MSRKVQRIAAKRFRSAEERKDIPSILDDDDLVVEIASYNKKPLSWNKHYHETFNCTPTNTSYKILREPGPGPPCPLLEAKLLDPENPNCCTSRVGPNTHQESLDFFKALKNIFVLVPPQHRILGNYPPNLRRLLQWLMSPTNTSEISTAPVSNPMVLNTEHERFLDLVKFAMMSRSHIRFRAVQNTGPPPNAAVTIDPFFTGGQNPFLLLDDRISLFDDLIRINNETGTTWQVVVENYTPPASVLPLPPIRANNFGYGGESPMYAANFDDMVALLDTCDNNGWNPSWVTVSHRVVTRPNVTVIQQFTSLFAALRRRNRRHLSFSIDTPAGAAPINVPPGYGPIDFQPGQFTQLVTALMGSVNGSNLTAIVHDVHYFFDFPSYVPPFGMVFLEIDRNAPHQIVMDVGYPAQPQQDFEIGG